MQLGLSCPMQGLLQLLLLSVVLAGTFASARPMVPREEMLQSFLPSGYAASDALSHTIRDFTHLEGEHADQVSELVRPSTRGRSVGRSFSDSLMQPVKKVLRKVRSFDPVDSRRRLQSEDIWRHSDNIIDQYEHYLIERSWNDIGQATEHLNKIKEDVASLPEHKHQYAAEPHAVDRNKIVDTIRIHNSHISKLAEIKKALSELGKTRSLAFADWTKLSERLERLIGWHKEAKKQLSRLSTRRNSDLSQSQSARFWSK